MTGGVEIRLPFLPPGARSAAEIGDAAEPAEAPPDLPRDRPLEIVCPQPVHHVLEFSFLYRLLDSLAQRAPERPIRLWLRSALEDWKPFERLPAGRIERLPARAEETFDALSDRTVLLLAPTARWEPRRRERFPDRFRVLPLEARWRPAGRDHAAACTDFFAALQRESPRWRRSAEAAGPIQLPPEPRFLLHQSRFHVGDALWITPLLRSLRRRFPGCSSTLLAPPAAVPVLAGNPHLDRLLAWRPGDGTRGEVERALGASGGFDAALFAFCRRPESRWVVEAAVEMGVPHRINLEYFDPALDWRRVGPGLTQEAWSFWGALPSPQLMLQAVEPFTAIGSPPEDRRVELGIAGVARRQVDRMLGRVGIGDQPFAILAPGGRSSRRWPVRRFGLLARWLADELGFHVLVEGSREEERRLRRVAAVAGPDRAAGPGRRILARAGSLLELAALLERARLLVANDSAPIHLAEATGTPTLYFAHQDKLVHSHPASAVSRALYEPLHDDPSRITLAQAVAALRAMHDCGLLAARAAPDR